MASFRWSTQAQLNAIGEAKALAGKWSLDLPFYDPFEFVHWAL